MTALVILGFVVPLLGAGLLAVSSRVEPRHVAEWAGAATALAWAGVAATATAPPAAGAVEVDAVLACGLAGLGLLVATRAPVARFGACGALVSIALVALAAGSEDPAAPGRRLGAAMAVLVVLAAIGFGREKASTVSAMTAVVGGVIVALALVVADATLTAVGVVVGAGALVAATAGVGLPGVLIVPVALVAVGRRAALLPEADAGLLGFTAAGVGVAIAVAIVVAGRRVPVDRAPVAAIGAAIVLLGQDVPGATSAGLLLAAGGILAVAARHPIGLIGLLPGVTATLAVAGAATEGPHAAAGAAVVALGLAAAARPPVASPLPTGPVGLGALASAATFGLVPVWGWAGADFPALVEAAAVGVAAGGIGAGARALSNITSCRGGDNRRSTAHR